MTHQDYIIRMDELDKPPPKGPKKIVARLRSFLGRTLRNPLVVGFSRDAKSSFTVFPDYRKPIIKKD